MIIPLRWMPWDLADDKWTLVPAKIAAMRQQAITLANANPDWFHHIVLPVAPFTNMDK